jgi:hypothetical protein
MKSKLLFLAISLIFLCAFSVPASAQNVRYDAPANQTPGATVQVCSVPVNGIPCSNFVTTYDFNGNACPNNKQDTPQPNGSCQATLDGQGRAGFWLPAGTYAYTVCVPGNNCSPPFTFSVAGSASGTGTITGVTASTGLTGGGSSGAVTVTLVTPVAVANGGTGAATLTGPVKGNGTSALSAAAATDIIGLFSTCSGTNYLGADSACHAAGTGTITAVTAGTGLSGGGSSGGVTVSLTNTGTTVNGQTCTLGSVCAIPYSTNSVANASVAGINFLTSTTNGVGLTVTPTNSTNQEKFEVTGGSYTGNAATATSAAGLNGTALSGLATGVLKNTTGTGVPSIAAASDITSLFTGCSGTNYLGADGACHSGGTGTVNSGTATQLAFYNTSTNAVSGNPRLVESGTTLSYAGSSGISAASGFTGAIGASTPSTGAFTSATISNLTQAQPMVAGSGGALGNSPAYFYALKLPNAGATPDTHVNNCIAWVLTYGGGSCEGRDDIGTQTFSNPIQFGKLLAPTAAASTGGTLTSGQPVFLAITLCSPNGQAPQGNCPGGTHETSPSEENTAGCAPSGGNLSCTVTSPDNTAANGYFGTATSYGVYAVQAVSPTHWAELFCAGSNTAIGSPAVISATCAGAAFTGPQKAGFPTEYSLPLYGSWNCAITTGAAVSCATFYQYTFVHAPGIGIGNRFNFSNNNASTNVFAICASTQNPVQVTTIMNLSGFGCSNTASGGGTMTSGSACVWSNTSDTFREDNVGCVDTKSGDFSTWSWNTGAGSSFFNHHGSSQTNAGAGACKIGKAGNGNTGTFYFGWSCPTAGTGANNLSVAAGFGEFGSFGLYLEKDSTDNATAMIDIAANGGGTFFATSNGASTTGALNPIFTFESNAQVGTYGVYGVSTTKVLMPIVSDISAGPAQAFFGHPAVANVDAYLSEPYVNGMGRGSFQDSQIVMESDDFLTGALTSPGIGNLNWSMQGSAACGTAAQPASALPNLGLFEVTTGASSGNTCGLTFATAGALGALGNAGGWDMTWIFKAPVTTNAGAYVGVSDSLTTVPANFFGFTFDTSLAATFRLCSIVASAPTCDATTYAADTNFHRLHLWSLNNNAATIIMQFDGNAPVTFCAASCTDTATPTTNAVTPIAQAVTRTSSAQQLILDYFALRYTVAR